MWSPEPKDCFRIVFVNIGGIPADSRDQKMEAIKHDTLNLNAQAIGLTECNVHWKKVPAFARLHERTLGWFEALGINTAYYEKYEAGSIFQPGGVSLWSRRPPNTVHRPRPKWPRMVGLDALQRKRRHSLASGHSVPTGTEYLWRTISVESTKGQFRSKRR